MSDRVIFAIVLLFLGVLVFSPPRGQEVRVIEVPRTVVIVIDDDQQKQDEKMHDPGWFMPHIIPPKPEVEVVPSQVQLTSTDLDVVIYNDSLSFPLQGEDSIKVYGSYDARSIPEIHGGKPLVSTRHTGVMHGQVHPDNSFRFVLTVGNRFGVFGDTHDVYVVAGKLVKLDGQWHMIDITQDIISARTIEAMIEASVGKDALDFEDIQPPVQEEPKKEDKIAPLFKDALTA